MKKMTSLSTPCESPVFTRAPDGAPVVLPPELAALNRSRRRTCDNSASRSLPMQRNHLYQFALDPSVTPQLLSACATVRPSSDRGWGAGRGNTAGLLAHLNEPFVLSLSGTRIDEGGSTADLSARFTGGTQSRIVPTAQRGCIRPIVRCEGSGGSAGCRDSIFRSQSHSHRRSAESRRIGSRGL